MYDSDTITALQAGALILRDMLTIHGWDGDGDPTDFCFWACEDDVTTNVVDARDGSTKSRDFIGGGSLLEVDPIIYSIGLEARSIDVKLSQIHASVQAAVRGNDIRHAVVEIHRALFDVATGAIVSTPFPRWLGKVDGAPIETPADGGEGSITIHCISNTIELTRTNPARKSDAQQQLRSGDRFRQYGDTAGQVEIWWGEQRGRDA
jgi:hypothetical protein